MEGISAFNLGEPFNTRFKEALARLDKQRQKGRLPCGRGSRVHRSGQDARPTARPYYDKEGSDPDSCVGADPDALQTYESEKLLKAAGPALLVGWKEIVQAIGNVSVRTVQRWELRFGLPIGRAGKIPIADPEEIRKWKERQRKSSEPSI